MNIPHANTAPPGTSPAGTTLPVLLTIAETAKALRISDREVRRMIQTCIFPPDGVVRPSSGGHRVLIREAVLLRFINQQTEAPLSFTTARDRKRA